MDLNQQLSQWLDGHLAQLDQAAHALGAEAEQRVRRLKDQLVLYTAQAAVSKQQGMEDADMLLANVRGLALSHPHELALDAIGFGQAQLQQLINGLLQFAGQLLDVAL